MTQNTAENIQPIDIKKRLFRFNTLIAIVVAAAIIYIFSRQFDIGKSLAIIAQVNLGLFMLAIFAFYISLPLRGYRWQELLKETGIKLPVIDLTRYYFLAWFANCILPAKIGDIYRAYLLKKNRNAPFSLSLGVLFSERVFDLATTASLFLLGGIFYFDKLDQPKLKSALIDGLVAIAFITIAFIIFSWRSEFFKRFIPGKIRRYYELFSEGLLRSPRKIPAITAESLIIWLTEALRLYLVAWALGMRIDFLLAVFISQAALIIMSIPLTPGGLGLVEILMTLLLSRAGFGGDGAAAIVIADRLISYWSLIILGGLHYLLSPRSR
jgi:uncharacterized membrane protein YbhN (UPF0104 family)